MSVFAWWVVVNIIVLGGSVRALVWCGQHLYSRFAYSGPVWCVLAGMASSHLLLPANFSPLWKPFVHAIAYLSNVGG